MGFGSSQDTHLVPKSYQHRQALAKMRSKLVTARRGAQAAPQLSMPAPERRGLRVVALAAAMLLVGSANVYSFLKRDALITMAEPLPEPLPLAAPSKGWNADEKAIFWAYAAYSPAKFDARFGGLKGQLVDRKKAAKHLEAHLSVAKLNPLVIKEIQALKVIREIR